MGKDRIKKFAGNFLFRMAEKGYKKKKREIVDSIEKERNETDKTTMEIIETFAENNKEDAYWVWLIYNLDMGIELDTENYEDPIFSGRCMGCGEVFTFTENDKKEGNVKCVNCEKTYSRNDIFAH